MTATQDTLFDVEPVYKEMSLDEQWWYFCAKNVPLTSSIEERACRMAADGATRISVKLLFELVRAEARPVAGSSYVLNNNLTAPCARWLIRRNPHLADLIETRPSKADEERT